MRIYLLRLKCAFKNRRPTKTKNIRRWNVFCKRIRNASINAFLYGGFSRFLMRLFNMRIYIYVFTTFIMRKIQCVYNEDQLRPKIYVEETSCAHWVNVQAPLTKLQKNVWSESSEERGDELLCDWRKSIAVDRKKLTDSRTFSISLSLTWRWLVSTRSWDGVRCM